MPEFAASNLKLARFFLESIAVNKVSCF